MLHAACPNHQPGGVTPKTAGFMPFRKQMEDFPILGKYIHLMILNAWPTFCPQWLTINKWKNSQVLGLLLGLPVLFGKFTRFLPIDQGSTWILGCHKLHNSLVFHSRSFPARMYHGHQFFGLKTQRFVENQQTNSCNPQHTICPRNCSILFWVCLKIGYIPNYSHLIGIMIINHWV